MQNRLNFAEFRMRFSTTWQRRGAMLVLIAFVLVVFLAMVAFAADVAYMQLCRTQLRIATDAAARAGGEALSRAQDMEVARQAAIDVAGSNMVAGQPLLLADNDIIAGHVAAQESGKWVFDPAGTPANGMRVKGRRTFDSPSGAVPLFFAGIFGLSDFETSQQTVVVRLDRDICLVIDRSSSMKLYVDETDPYMSTSDPRFCQPPHPTQSRWSALEDAVQVFHTTLEETEPLEFVAVVSYASTGQWCGGPNQSSTIDQYLTDNVGLAQAAVDAYSSRVFNGGTEISAGIDDGVVALTDGATARPFAAKTMVVLTDGHQQGGGSPVEAAQDAAAAGITVHTITFGNGANQVQMQAVADVGGGTHYHAVDEEELQEVFREIALTLPVVITE